MKTDPYYVRVGGLCRSIIRLREYLLQSGLSQRTDAGILQDFTFLKNLLQANRYDSDLKAAWFFSKHVNRIRNLIPGRKSPLYDALHGQVDHTLAEGQLIIAHRITEFNQGEQPRITPISAN